MPPLTSIPMLPLLPTNQKTKFIKTIRNKSFNQLKIINLIQKQWLLWTHLISTRLFLRARLRGRNRRRLRISWKWLKLLIFLTTGRVREVRLTIRQRWRRLCWLSGQERGFSILGKLESFKGQINSITYSPRLKHLSIVIALVLNNLDLLKKQTLKRIIWFLNAIRIEVIITNMTLSMYQKLQVLVKKVNKMFRFHLTKA